MPGVRASMRVRVCAGMCDKNTFDLLNVSRLDYNLGTVRMAPMELICSLIVNSMDGVYFSNDLYYTSNNIHAAMYSPPSRKTDDSNYIEPKGEERPCQEPALHLYTCHLYHLNSLSWFRICCTQYTLISLSELDQSMRILMPLAHNTIINIRRRRPNAAEVRNNLEISTPTHTHNIIVRVPQWLFHYCPSIWDVC